MIRATYTVTQGALDKLEALLHDIKRTPPIEYNAFVLQKADRAMRVDVRNKAQCIPGAQDE